MLRQEPSKPNLFVYKASAGSGKTHRITSEYLSLLYSDKDQYAYKHILAVTFTNKATDEMKGRIIEELANLATNRKSDYVDLLSKEYKLTEDAIREKARTILVKILHDYSSFSVSTIDKFFQQTMRAFTREIGLGGGYNVELDTQSVLLEAIDLMLGDLEKSENKQLLEWLIRFSEEKVENGQTWNIRNDIQALSSEIFKESYKNYSAQVRKNIEDKELMKAYKNMLLELIYSFEKEARSIGERGANAILRYGLTPEDFKGGSRSPFLYFAKVANGAIEEPTATFRKLEDNVSSWYTAKASSEVKSAIESSYTDVNECVGDIVRHFDNSSYYQTAVEINKYFFTLGILGDIDAKIRQHTAENNIMLISDTTELLSRIIEGNDTPFIYEKAGTRISHYMMDEFQDTSGMQWDNFHPLVKDSLAEGNRNFIVGDVKQSIYRWRNSDWKLLDEQLDIDFESEGIQHETLNMNWRSDKNIINFNNAIFTQGASLLQDTYNVTLGDNIPKNLEHFQQRITKAYDGLYQHIPEKKQDTEGYVKVEFIDTTEYNWEDRVLELLPIEIENLQDKGFKLEDIAILVRTKKEGVEVANCLLQYKSAHKDSPYKYDIISDEALYVGNSQSIKLIIALLRYMQDLENTSLKALAIYEYLKYSGKLIPEDALQKYFSEDEQLPDEILAALKRIAELPLYEMAEEIFELFQEAIKDDDQIYIHSFLDMVLDFTTKKTSDLDAFLKWWDETGIKKTIFTTDGQDAIRIMTIHKSKGLGFKVMLIPFCNWAIDHRLPTILWCKPKVEPFNMLHLVPVKYSKNLENSIFNYEYFEEKIYAYIDNLNVLYVAFTRAKNGLVAFAPKPKKDDINDTSSLLWNCLNIPSVQDKDRHDFISLNSYLDDEKGVFLLGEDTKDEAKEKINNASEIEITDLPSISYESRLKLRLKNKYYFTESGQRDYGTLMHEIVSSIATIDDLDSAIEKYYIEGSITENQKVEVKQLLLDYLNNPIVKEWYQDGIIVLNEVAILQPNGTTVRPDRVMIKDGKAIVIDYKFGQLESNKYLKQVQNYKSQIEQMGYKDVEGYVCYISLGKVVQI